MGRSQDDKMIGKLVDEALFMEHIPAKETGNLAFLARILVLATMPHSKTDELVWQRRNGKYQLAMVAHPHYGLPYGAQARLLLAWITTQAIKTRMPVIVLGDSMSQFMATLGIAATGGKRGTIHQFKAHAKRLFTTTISFTYNDEESGAWIEQGSRLVHRTQMWWDPLKPDEEDNRPTRIELSGPFFEELMAHPVPLDLRALGALRKSPLAIDIYNWLTYRYSTLQNPVIISWRSLQMQFGCDYGNKDQFRQNFLKQLAKVKVLYPKANIAEVPRKGVKLWPSPTHVTPTH